MLFSMIFSFLTLKDIGVTDLPINYEVQIFKVM